MLIARCRSEESFIARGSELYPPRPEVSRLTRRHGYRGRVRIQRDCPGLHRPVFEIAGGSANIDDQGASMGYLPVVKKYMSAAVYFNGSKAARPVKNFRKLKGTGEREPPVDAYAQCAVEFPAARGVSRTSILRFSASARPLTEAMTRISTPHIRQSSRFDLLPQTHACQRSLCRPPGYGHLRT